MHPRAIVVEATVVHVVIIEVVTEEAVDSVETIEVVTEEAVDSGETIGVVTEEAVDSVETIEVVTEEAVDNVGTIGVVTEEAVDNVEIIGVVTEEMEVSDGMKEAEDARMIVNNDRVMTGHRAENTKVAMIANQSDGLTWTRRVGPERQGWKPSALKSHAEYSFDGSGETEL